MNNKMLAYETAEILELSHIYYGSSSLVGER